jgi:50S ribosomal protein L16 3-hydroxylase
MTGTLLGGLSARAFLARHWQREPLLVRGAIPGFADPVDLAGLRALAQRDDVESRLVVRSRGRWRLEHGPLARAAFAALPARDWTLLVQGLDHVVPAAARLLARFAFVPWARLDDVMVSYAAPGGGVGPHEDSYDVFLLQGTGRRRWRISRQRGLAVDARAPLKVVRGFVPEAEWVLERGDLLYLPPGIVHEGVALDPCTTYSIGFRAPAAGELAREFLRWLEDRIVPGGAYRDPGIAPAAHPGRVPADMVDRIAAMLAAIRWTRADVARFAGAALSEPKAHVLFTPPARRLSPAAFARAVSRHGVRLAGGAILLVHGRHAYANGEESPLPAAARAPILRLADRRALAPATEVTAAALALLYSWHRSGYLLTGIHDE